jgi:hypothetical protein
MPDILSKSQLMTALKSKTTALHIDLNEESEDRLNGHIEAIKSKWFLGGRKVDYRISVQLAEPERAVLFREAVFEKSWGVPPPTFSVEVETISGWKRSGQRKDVSVGGGGSMDYAQVREAVAQAAAEAGWQFRLEGGRLP